MRIAIIGAGFSGILAAIRFRQKFSNIDLVLYEKNSGVGGTWLENKYPGVAVDTPSHNYTFNFENNPNLSQYFAPGAEILKYLEHVAQKYKVHDIEKYNHRLDGANWIEEEGYWVLKLTHTVKNVSFEDTADFVLQATGILNAWDMPEIKGITTFKGKLMHTAGYDDSVVKDWSNVRLGVIGNGASGIQVVTTLQPKVKHLTLYARNKSWVAGRQDHDLMKELNMDLDADNPEFPSEVRERFAKDPEFHKTFRVRSERAQAAQHALTQKDHPLAIEFGKILTASMSKELKAKPDIAEKLIPNWPVCCRRMNPAPGYLKAISQSNVDTLWDPIEEITETGIRTKSGATQELDVIICATGFRNVWIPPFHVVGRNGATFAEKYADHAKTYFTVATDDFPNWSMSMGPGSGFGTGQILHMIDIVVNYGLACAAKIQRDRLKSLSIKRDAVLAFMDYSDRYFPQTNFLAGCNAWYQRNGRVVGIYPGSVAHIAKALEHPRWEDFDVTYQGKRLDSLGNGWTHAEKNGGETALYMVNIDVPPIPGEDEPADSWRLRQANAPLPPVGLSAEYFAASTD